jgi:hypothetical protein
MHDWMQPLIRACDSVLISALIVQLVKGTDLALRKSQRKWLQDATETLTLRLDYAHPLRFYKSLNKQGLILTAVLVLIIPTLWASNAVPLDQDVSPKVGAFAFVALLAGLLFYVWIGWDLGGSIIGYLWDDPVETVSWMLTGERRGDVPVNGLLVVVLRFLIVIVRLVVPFAMLTLILVQLFAIVKFGHFILRIPSKNSSESVLLILAASICLPFGGIGLLLIVPTCAVLIATALLLYCSELVLKFGRGLCWRIVEYDKGVASALGLLATILVGILDAWLRLHKSN